MLEHLNARPVRPGRVVVAGAAGFVGNAIATRLEQDGVAVVRLGRSEVDLAAADAAERLAGLLRPGDAFVAAAARAPCRNPDMLVENVRIVQAMLVALGSVRPSHIVNISSDAVYADLSYPITESSCASPGTLHGTMHLAREVIFRSEFLAPLAVLRPTLLYGSGDPHNGYGPNRFRRLAAKGEDIVLFGEGEERRDHVYIDDLAELAVRVIYRRSAGLLNVATGDVHSFRDIAQKVVALSGQSVTIKESPRRGPMPHNGYRPFDPAGCLAAFPDFVYTKLDEGLARAQQAKAG